MIRPVVIQVAHLGRHIFFLLELAQGQDLVNVEGGLHVMRARTGLPVTHGHDRIAVDGTAQASWADCPLWQDLLGPQHGGRIYKIGSY